MAAADKYTTLMSSLPHLGQLFAAKQTPLSRIRLETRLQMLETEDRALLREIEKLLQWWNHSIRRSDAEIAALARQLMSTLRDELLRDIVSWRLELRTLVAALRRRKLGQKAPSGLRDWGFGRWLDQIRRYWSEPGFRLEGVFPWVLEADRLLKEQDTVGLERLLLIARGGTGCIPGPFGAGKTVLQHLISRYADVDIVIVVACGERAGEVVETITEFPKLKDPRGSGSLMDRTIIVCNTSSMPVAAREASIYTGVTLGEYYRQMGYDVLLIADSTSRWAQAMRETSGRMEEIPGEEAFPAYLDSSIKGIYERAGIIRTNDGALGSLTMIGTVSPAGGNFEEPVTQSTLATVKTFLGLSAERAYKRFYPAVDPLLSWSRYLDQLSEWFEKQLEQGWTARVKEMLDLLEHGNGVLEMMQVTGEEGITLEDFVVHQKSLFVDMVYLQQDAFDTVDASAPLGRQKRMFGMVYALVTREYRFDDKNAARAYFTRLTGLCKNLNYTAVDSPQYVNYMQQIDELADSVTVKAYGPQTSDPSRDWL